MLQINLSFLTKVKFFNFKWVNYFSTKKMHKCNQMCLVSLLIKSIGLYFKSLLEQKHVHENK